MSKKLTTNQIAKLHELDKDMVIEIMHECAEILGVVSVKEYFDATCFARRTVYDYMQSGKLKYFSLSGHKFPVINLNSEFMKSNSHTQK